MSVFSDQGRSCVTFYDLASEVTLMKVFISLPRFKGGETDSNIQWSGCQRICNRVLKHRVLKLTVGLRLLSYDCFQLVLIVYFLVLAYMFSLGLTGCFLLFFCLSNNRMFLIPPSYSLYHWCHSFNLYISIYKPIQGLPLVARTVKNPPAMMETRVQSLGWGDPLEREWQGNGSPPQYSCLEKSKDREAWQATVHGVTKSQTQWSN